VGLPLDASDRIGARAERTLAFVRLLAHATSRPVETCDERYTTDEAHEMLRDAGLRAARRKRLADSVAALVILERFRSGG
ncbi:MAG: Holliday junction resolvase RuvX, partial [Planctomycetes bacterium]|nr:Holliday junction resolvase RuvX [Planctomycetota bacterium]